MHSKKKLTLFRGVKGYIALILAGVMSFGLVGKSSAITCDGTASSDDGVVIDVGIYANACGEGSTSNDTVPDIIANWQVNLDGIDGGGWAFYEKEETDKDGNPIHDGNTSAIGLSATGINGGTSGTFSLTAYDPLLIVLKDGEGFNYHWYLFDGLTGPQTGTWNTNAIFDGKALSHMTAYAKVIPVPAAVWLFGSGLLGLVGVARRRKNV